VWFEPGERHWHGASPATAMAHIAIAEMLDGEAVEWMEHVTDRDVMLFLFSGLQTAHGPIGARLVKPLNLLRCLYAGD